MNRTDEPCGPWRPVGSSMPWQSEQVICFEGPLSGARHSGRTWLTLYRSRLDPVVVLAFVQGSAATTGWYERLFGLSSRATSVSGFPETPVGGAAGSNAKLEWHLKQISYSRVADAVQARFEDVGAAQLDVGGEKVTPVIPRIGLVAAMVVAPGVWSTFPASCGSW